MTTGMLMVFAAVSVLLPCEAFGQASSDNVIDAVRISGRIIGFAGAPVPEQTLSIRNLQAAGPPQVSTVKTNEDGRFVFAAHGHIAYEFYIVVPMSPPAFIGIGMIEAVGGVDVDMGSIVTQFSSAPEPAIDLAQQIRVAPAR